MLDCQLIHYPRHYKCRIALAFNTSSPLTLMIRLRNRKDALEIGIVQSYVFRAAGHDDPHVAHICGE